MLKKIDLAEKFLKEHGGYFRCPKCHHQMSAVEKSLICKNNHRFDLAKKGTLYFLDHQIKTEYQKEMFVPRGKMIASGMYQPVINQISEWQKGDNILDVGCGEGSFLNQLSQLKEIPTKIGFDISKEGIYLATNQLIKAFWCVADLTNLPFSDDSFTTILNIFSPSQYSEFRRVLKKGGQVLKVVPQENYLKELREKVFPDGKPYSNQAVIERFKEEMSDVRQRRVTYEFDIPDKLQLDFLEMSPLEWQATAEIKAQLIANPLKKITIDVEILEGY
ncbi:methyltransferase domain-containing protein [Enterococcus alishanensis]|uniref:Methyltransferase domain-containing protein n=1 Tax=Enterococcus alishanensis TaxID=1303817 RepID=A0ABS6TF81_9ENTE|nr:methyltransferase domain-containing protein [Enterococcus alishanensis]MBV7391542.1 methyltransferase domain-containing protein [Enterococcus alishanensis]